jgi:hypothetical protein
MVKGGILKVCLEACIRLTSLGRDQPRQPWVQGGKQSRYHMACS